MEIKINTAQRPAPFEHMPALQNTTPHEPGFLVYGANGYTGKLIVAEAVKRGLMPVLAGRNESQITTLANAHGLKSATFNLESVETIRTNIRGMNAVLHAAGPFTSTAAKMLEACLAEGVHYLDITGEVQVLEHIFTLNERAKECGCVLIPAVGFDVVPTDCLAMMLKSLLPDAVRLQLAFHTKVKLSRGTWKATIEAMPRRGFTRQDGVLTRVPHAWKLRRILYDDGQVWSMTVPWGDVSSSYVSTGIPYIEFYIGTSLAASIVMRLMRPLAGITARPTVRKWLYALVDRYVKGPNEKDHTEQIVHLRGDVWNAKGSHAALQLTTPEGYIFTARAAVQSVQALLESPLSPGVYTPAMAFGKDFIRAFEHVHVIEVDPEERVAFQF